MREISELEHLSGDEIVTMLKQINPTFNVLRHERDSIARAQEHLPIIQKSVNLLHQRYQEVKKAYISKEVLDSINRFARYYSASGDNVEAWKQLEEAVGLISLFPTLATYIEQLKSDTISLDQRHEILTTLTVIAETYHLRGTSYMHRGTDDFRSARANLEQAISIRSMVVEKNLVEKNQPEYQEKLRHSQACLTSVKFEHAAYLSKFKKADVLDQGVSLDEDIADCEWLLKEIPKEKPITKTHHGLLTTLALLFKAEGKCGLATFFFNEAFKGFGQKQTEDNMDYSILIYSSIADMHEQKGEWLLAFDRYAYAEAVAVQPGHEHYQKTRYRADNLCQWGCFLEKMIQNDRIESLKHNYEKEHTGNKLDVESTLQNIADNLDQLAKDSDHSAQRKADYQQKASQWRALITDDTRTAQEDHLTGAMQTEGPEMEMEETSSSSLRMGFYECS